MVSSWERLASVTASSGDSITTPVFTAKKYLMITLEIDASSDGKWRFGNTTIDTGSNYAQADSANGSSRGGNVNRSNIECSYGSTPQFIKIDIGNIANREKLGIGQVISGATGASNVPNRKESNFKWVNTSNQINIVQSYGWNTISYATLTVWGADDQGSTTVDHSKTSLTNIPIGTRYEETDTRKIFRRAIQTATHTQSASNTLTGIDLNQPTGGGGWGIKIVTGHTLVGKKMNSITFNMRIANAQNYATQTITLKHFGSAPATIRATGSTMSSDDVHTSTSTDYTFTFANPVTIQADDFILMTVPNDMGTSGGWYATISDGGEETGSYVATWTENSSSFGIQTGQSRKMTYSAVYQSGEAWVEKGTA